MITRLRRHAYSREGWAEQTDIMGDKLLARAFELAQSAIKAEKEDKLIQAKDLFTAAIDTFKAVLSIPGFIQDDSVKQLIQSEVLNLQQRKSGLLSRATQGQELEARLRKLKDPGEPSNIRERLDKLKGLDKPGMTEDQLRERLQTLKGDQTVELSGAIAPTKPKLAADNPFVGEEWKQGMDPDLLRIIEQARDETNL